MRVLPTFVLFALASLAAAQSTWTVDSMNGPGTDFTEIADAIAAAGEGDTIVVRNGFYGLIHVDGKSLTITAEAGASPVISPFTFGGSNPALLIENLAAGQRASVRGMRFAHTFTTTMLTSISCRDCMGSIWLEDCDTLTTPAGLMSPRSGMRVTSCDNLVVTRCFLSGSDNSICSTCPMPPGVLLVDSNTAIYDSRIEGCDGSNSVGAAGPQTGGNGLVIEGGTCYLSGSNVTGGQGGPAFLLQPAADGGIGLLQLLDSTVTRALDTTIAGGPGGPGNGTPPGNPGQDLVVNAGTFATLTGTARSAVIDSPVRPATEALVETFNGLPGDVVLMAYSTSGPLAPFFLPAGKGPLVIAPNLVISTKGTCDANGELVTTPMIGALSPGVSSQVVYLQGAMVGLDGITLTSPMTLVLLAN